MFKGFRTHRRNQPLIINTALGAGKLKVKNKNRLMLPISEGDALLQTPLSDGCSPKTRYYEYTAGVDIFCGISYQKY